MSKFTTVPVELSGVELRNLIEVAMAAERTYMQQANNLAGRDRPRCDAKRRDAQALNSAVEKLREASTELGARITTHIDAASQHDRGD